MKLSNESYFSLNFIARKARPNKEGEIPIALRIKSCSCYVDFSVITIQSVVNMLINNEISVNNIPIIIVPIH